MLPGSKKDLDSLHYIDTYFQPEPIDLMCERCNGTCPAVRQVSPIAFPKVLLIQLKRFKWEANRLQKIKTLVNAPLLIKPARNSPDFELVSTISHTGSVESGHYVAHVCNENEWFSCNDQKVSRCELSDVVSENTYLILYRQKMN